MMDVPRYSPELFRVRARDLDRMARRIERTGEAHDLTQLTRRFIRGRLRYGMERGSVLASTPGAGERVRLWDPATVWHQGDWALFPVPTHRDRDRSHSPCFGEIVRVQGQSVVARLDGYVGTRVYGMAIGDREGDAVAEWRRSVEELVAILSESDEEHLRIDHVFWSRGATIASDIRGALCQDARFIALDGRWMLRRLIALPSSDQLEELARAMMFEVDRPLTADELVLRLVPPQAAGDAGVFGLAAALHERPDLFSRIPSGARSRWVVSALPPGSYRARLAAYDPETYVLLCEPGQALSPEVAQRLWELDLLPVIVDRRAVSTGVSDDLTERGVTTP